MKTNPYHPGVAANRDAEQSRPVLSHSDAPAVQFATELTDKRYDEVRRVWQDGPIGMRLIRSAAIAVAGILSVMCFVAYVYSDMPRKLALATAAFVGVVGLACLAVFAMLLAVVWLRSKFEVQAAWHRERIGNLRGEVSRERVYLTNDDAGVLIPADFIASMNWQFTALQIRTSSSFMDLPRTRYSIPEEAFYHGEKTVFPIPGAVFDVELDPSKADWQAHVDWVLEQEGIQLSDVVRIAYKSTLLDQFQGKRPFQGAITSSFLLLQEREHPVMKQFRGLEGLGWTPQGIALIDSSGESPKDKDSALVPAIASKELDHARVKQWILAGTA